jgi:hypothetical protein
MSTEDPKLPGQPDDLAEIRGALSPKVGLRALDARIRQHPQFFEFLWEWRFWWIVAALATFVLPVLTNDNTLTLSYSRSINLYGFDLLVPVISQNDSYNVVSVRSFSINPMALVIYGLAALHLYLIFVKSRVSAHVTLWHGVIQTVLTLLFPFLDIPVLNMVLPSFKSFWHVQPPQVGFWILLVSGIMLWAGGYGRVLRGLSIPEVPPPLR